MTPLLHIRSRIVWTVDQPPFEDGALLVEGDRVRAVGYAGDVPAPAGARRVDLGDVILLPGLVNAHCHLDYTGMAVQVAPAASFTDWIKSITTLKATWSAEDFRASWLAGAGMLQRRGVTTVADIEAIPELLPAVWEATSLRVVSLLEMTGVKSRRDPGQIVDEAVAKLAALPAGRCRGGLSPHAPYSTVPALLRASALAARTEGWLLTTHVAESAEEDEMFAHGRGRMFDWLARNERDMSDCGGVSPVQHLERHGLLGPNLLAVHANYLHPGDAETLAARGASVVHCPRSHSYFSHRPFPRTGLERAGVNVCLGTDSLVTVHKRQEQVLDLFAEMREFVAHAPGVAPGYVVRLATLNGARALGLAGLAGCLAPGAWADAIAVPFPGGVVDVARAVVNHHGDVAASLIGGQWALPPGAVAEPRTPP
jgi:cytosine/adenosine deaminase-related metal-dependent hydrolase